MSRFLTTILMLSMAGSAAAQSMTGNVSLSMIRTGWNADMFALVTAQPMINPAGCPNANGYISSNTLAGYQTYLSASLAAFSLDAPVVITVHDTEC